MNKCGSWIPAIGDIVYYSKEILDEIDSCRSKWYDFEDEDLYIIICLKNFFGIFEQNVVQYGKSDLLCRRISDICNGRLAIFECKKVFVKRWNILHYVITNHLKNNSIQTISAKLRQNDKLQYIDYPYVISYINQFYDELRQICLHIGNIDCEHYSVKCNNLRNKLERLQNRFSYFKDFIPYIHVIPCHYH